MCSKIAAQANNRHTVIDTSDPLIETAEIDSITLTPSASEQDGGPTPREHISLEDRLIRQNPETPCQRSFSLRKSIEDPMEIQDQSLPRPKKRSVRVGKKSVYGTEDSHGNIFGIATDYCLGDLASTQADNQYLNQRSTTNEWGGDTLVASQAQNFINLNRMSDSKHCEDSLLMPRKRVSPGKRPRGSLSSAQTSDKEPESQYGDNHHEDVASIPMTDLDMAERDQELAPSDLGSDLSSGTILLKTTTVDTDEEARQQHGGVSTPTPEVGISLSQGGPSTPFDYIHEIPWRTVIASESIATRKTWRSPCQEESSLKSRSRKRVKRSRDASLTGPHIYPARAPGIEQREKRIRSRSLSESVDLCRKESETRTSDNLPEAKHTAFMRSRASGQKIKRKFAESIIPTTARTSMRSENSIHPKRSRSLASELPPIPRTDTLHSVAAEDGAFRSDKPQKNMQGEGKVSLSDDDRSSYSLDLEQSDTRTQIIPRKNRIPTSPDISDRPWIRREIPSSKYFPEDTGSLGRVSPMRQPFWIKYMGKLIICFPTNVNPGLYEVEVVARTWLSKADKSDWLIFKIPGLPYLDKPQVPGRLSFSLTTDLRYQIDRSLLEESFTCGPRAMGSSRFGPSPLLRLHSEVLPSEIKREEVYFSPGDMHMSAQRCKVLESLSFEDGNPHNAIVLWLIAEIEKAMFHRRSEDAFAIWFTRLDFTQLRSAMTDILYQQQRSPSVPLKDTSTGPKTIGSNDLSNKANRTDNTTQNDDLSTWANGKIRLVPAYFAGLFTVVDPLKSEDLSKIAWNLDISVTRGINGKLQCRLILEFSSRTPPLLTVDGRDWLPNFATINGKVATQMEWRETEDGDLSLHHVNGLATADTIKIELHFQEHTFAEAHFSQSELRNEFRLPNVVDKVILGGTLTCGLDNTIITLAEPNCEDVFWRTSSLDGGMSTALPKLHLGYTMYMAVGKRGERAAEDLESLPDMQTVLDLASPTPQPGHTDIYDMTNYEGSAIQSQTSLASSSQDGVSSSLADKDDRQGNRATASMATQSAEIDLIEVKPDRTAEPVRQGTARFSFRRLICYLVIAFVLIRFQLRIRNETLIEYDAQGQSEGFPGEMNCAEERHQAIGIEDENDGPMIEAMHGSQRNGDVEVRVADAAQGSGQGGMSWRDMIDHALGWQELDG